MARKRRKFSPEFKDQAVKLVKDTGKSVAAVARDVDCRSRRCTPGSSSTTSTRVGARPAPSRPPSGRS